MSDATEQQSHNRNSNSSSSRRRSNNNKNQKSSNVPQAVTKEALTNGHHAEQVPQHKSDSARPQAEGKHRSDWKVRIAQLKAVQRPLRSKPASKEEGGPDNGGEDSCQPPAPKNGDSVQDSTSGFYSPKHGIVTEDNNYENRDEKATSPNQIEDDSVCPDSHEDGSVHLDSDEDGSVYLDPEQNASMQSDASSDTSSVQGDERSESSLATSVVSTPTPASRVKRDDIHSSVALDSPDVTSRTRVPDSESQRNCLDVKIESLSSLIEIISDKRERKLFARELEKCKLERKEMELQQQKALDDGTAVKCVPLAFKNLVLAVTSLFHCLVQLNRHKSSQHSEILLAVLLLCFLRILDTTNMAAYESYHLQVFKEEVDYDAQRSPDVRSMKSSQLHDYVKDELSKLKIAWDGFNQAYFKFSGKYQPGQLLSGFEDTARQLHDLSQTLSVGDYQTRQDEILRYLPPSEVGSVMERMSACGTYSMKELKFTIEVYERGIASLPLGPLWAETVEQELKVLQTVSQDIENRYNMLETMPTVDVVV